MESPLRDWQASALREFAEWRRRPSSNGGYLVEATPGSGKTRFAIEAARELMAGGLVERIVIAVPTRRLERQWADEFAKFGISINPNWQAGNGRLAPDEQGCAVTYGEIAYQPQIFRMLTSRRRTLVILDEVHHCGDERSWGDTVRTAFEAAAFKLLLSGTPFRSDNNEIPFVRYVDNVGAPDFRYGYDQALAAGVVRVVFFERIGGVMEWDDRFGDRQTNSFDDDINERQMSDRLRTALAPNGELVRSALVKADEQLSQLRDDDPPAGGIVFCIDDQHARAVHRLLLDMGRDAVLAISTEDESDSKIAAFTHERTPWIVSIRKVSEGVDIPRLRVAVYLTTWVTELFFRQAVGRVVRLRPTDDEATAWMFIPDDPRLREFALRIKEQIDSVIDDDDIEPRAAQADLFDQPDTSLFMPISATPSYQGVISDAAIVSADEMQHAEQFKVEHPDLLMIPTPHVARMLRAVGITSSVGAFVVPPPMERAPYERKQQLKQENSRWVARIAAAHKIEHANVNNSLNGAIGVQAIGHATEEQLEARIGHARRWLATGKL